jgi:hypothetical protein
LGLSSAAGVNHVKRQKKKEEEILENPEMG